MEKGKHALSKREQIKQRAKKQIAQRLIILVICLICIVIIIQTQNENREVSASQDKSVEQQEAENQEQEENEGSNTDSSEKSETEVEEEPVTPTEDEEIKTLITEIKTANNLTADNFAFFYYNPQTQKYYFDNQDKYFKGASTVKVPVAMIYYDKIRNGELT